MNLHTLILVLTISSVALMDSSYVLPLFTEKEPLTSQEYMDRADYFNNLVSYFPGNRESISCSNKTQTGTFKVHWKFPLSQISLYSVQISGIMEHNASSVPGIIPNELEQLYLPITLQRNMDDLSQYDFYFEFTILDMETYFIRTKQDNHLKFQTSFWFFFNSSEYKSNSLMLSVFSILTLSRPEAVPENSPAEGSYETKTISLNSSQLIDLQFDLGVAQTLSPCGSDTATNDLATCTPTNDPVLYKLNEVGKFMLSLDNSDFADVYYLKMHKVTLKTENIPEVDFTSNAGAQMQLGKLIFNLKMAMVSDSLTLRVIATLSTTPSRRMLESTTKKAIVSETTVQVKNANPNGLTSDPSPSTALSYILLLPIILWTTLLF